MFTTIKYRIRLNDAGSYSIGEFLDNKDSEIIVNLDSLESIGEVLEMRNPSSLGVSKIKLCRVIFIKNSYIVTEKSREDLIKVMDSLLLIRRVDD